MSCARYGVNAIRGCRRLKFFFSCLNSRTRDSFTRSARTLNHINWSETSLTQIVCEMGRERDFQYKCLNHSHSIVRLYYLLNWNELDSNIEDVAGESAMMVKVIDKQRRAQHWKSRNNLKFRNFFRVATCLLPWKVKNTLESCRNSAAGV